MRKVLLATPLDVRAISELLVHDEDRGFVHQFRFTGERCGVSWLADLVDAQEGQLGVNANRKLEAPPGHRLHLTIAVEPEPRHAAVIDEKELNVARARLIECIETSATSADTAMAIERLIAARIARALRVHCDADHADEE